jgi:hypothetical protein
MQLINPLNAQMQALVTDPQELARVFLVTLAIIA